MAKKGIPFRIRLSSIFVSLTILLVGGASLFESMAIDYYSVLNTLMKIIPASLAMGGLGWVMGMILDQPKRRSHRGYGHSIISNIMKNTAPSEDSSVGNEGGSD